MPIHHEEVVQTEHDVEEALNPAGDVLCRFHSVQDVYAEQALSRFSVEPLLDSSGSSEAVHLACAVRTGEL